MLISARSTRLPSSTILSRRAGLTIAWSPRFQHPKPEIANAFSIPASSTSSDEMSILHGWELVLRTEYLP